jgi:hypothetical protein
MSENGLQTQPIRLQSPARAKITARRRLISDALPFGRLWYGEPNGGDIKSRGTLEKD